jgi:uncharacterized protein (DUF302 family)
MIADGLVTVRSNHGPKETMSRLEAEVKTKGLPRVRARGPCGGRG